MAASNPTALESPAQIVDPTVSEAKFKRELDIFLEREDAQRKRGIILLKAEFPDMEFVFMAPQITPAPVVFAARFNFTNYDLEAPSIRMINPFTGELLLGNQMITDFPRQNPANPHAPIKLLQVEQPDGIPFLCFPGVREYHNHPYHTGDSWLLHRKIGGEGTLGYLLDKLYDYGISPLIGFHFQIAFNAPQIQLGFDTNKLTE